MAAGGLHDRDPDLAQAIAQVGHRADAVAEIVLVERLLVEERDGKIVVISPIADTPAEAQPSRQDDLQAETWAQPAEARDSGFMDDLSIDTQPAFEDTEPMSSDWQRLRDAITPRTRLIFINSPHNPSGALLSRADLDQLAALIRDRDIYLISDEVYEHLVFDGAEHASVLAHDELYARALVVSSFGKTYHVTGWKTGYVVAPSVLSAELRKIHQYVNFCGVTPLQHALADFMAEHPQHIAELPAFYQAKRDLFCDQLAGSRFTFTRSPGTYFQLADYSAIRPDLDDVAMAEWLTREHGVAAIPVSVFYQSAPEDMRQVRFCFAKREETLRQAAEKLSAV